MLGDKLGFRWWTTGVWASLVAQMVRNLPAMQEMKVWSLGQIDGEGNGYPVQGSCLENPRDGGAWWAAVYGVAQSQTWLKWLSSSSSSQWFCMDKNSMDRGAWRALAHGVTKSCMQLSNFHFFLMQLYYLMWRSSNFILKAKVNCKWLLGICVWVLIIYAL